MTYKKIISKNLYKKQIPRGKSLQMLNIVGPIGSAEKQSAALRSKLRLDSSVIPTTVKYRKVSLLLKEFT